MIRGAGRRWGTRVAAGVAVAALLVFGGMGSDPQAYGAGSVKMLETGSTLLYPLFNLWVPDYTKAHPDVEITTQGTGSGTGIAEAISGAAQIGASDAYLAPGQMQQNPGMLNIPLAISYQQINYSIPGMNAQSDHLQLDGPTIAAIYSGSVKNWNDPMIAKQNLGKTLSDHQIIPIHRSDGSGDTFIFTQFLSATTPSWQSGAGFGTAVNWPSNPVGVGATGNPGMVQSLKQTPYAIAYVGVSWIDETTASGIGYAALKNQSGRYVLPTVSTALAAAGAMVGKTPPNEIISLIYAPGVAAYPIINYEYAIVNQKQPDAATAAAVKAFLTWCLSTSGGSQPQFLAKVHFVALPSAIAKLSQAQVDKIGP